MTRAGTDRTGAVLLEVVLAIAIFVMAATAILVLEDRSFSGLSRMREAEQARDMACSAMARLECGLDTARTLSGPVKPEQGFAAPAGKWELKVESEPSQFAGLTKVSVTAMKKSGGRDSDAVSASYTLRQLVRLGEPAVDRPGEEDPLAALAGARAEGGGEK
jgi:hypothetical protein